MMDDSAQALKANEEALQEPEGRHDWWTMQAGGKFSLDDDETAEASSEAGQIVI